MATELQELGVNINLLFKDGLVDGFEVRDRSAYEGGQTLSSWRDHRIFMSLFVASLRHENSNLIDGYADVDCSFPGFFEQFERNGASFEVVSNQGSLSPMLAALRVKLPVAHAIRPPESTCDIRSSRWSRNACGPC
jgi:EPSP synthase (3-phosphoshikimate 1-carboxyvinyltransferase)